VLAPLLMMGGALGGVEGAFLPALGPGFWPLVSMGAILGGTTRSPLTGIVFAIELTHDLNMLVPLLRPLGAERAAGADRDRRRQRLEHRELRLDAAAVDQDRLDRFGNAVAADPLGPIAGHESDDEADDGDDDDHAAQLDQADPARTVEY